MNKITIVLFFVGAFVLINCRSDSRKYSKKNHLINRLEKPLVCNQLPEFFNNCISLQKNLRWYNSGPNCYRFVDYSCTYNASFFLTESDCLAKCQKAPGCVVPKCSADLSCPYGRDVDSRGCFTCQCKDPCKDNPCKAGKVCKVITLPCNDGSPCFKFEKAECVANCPDLACPYGVDTDSATCKCKDVCLDNSGKPYCGSNLLCRRTFSKNYNTKHASSYCEIFIRYWIITIIKVISISEFEIYQRMLPIYTEYLKSYIHSRFNAIRLEHFDIFKISVSNDTKSSNNKVVKLYILLRTATSDDEWHYHYIVEKMSKNITIESIVTNNCTAISFFKAKNILTFTGNDDEKNDEEEKSDEDEKSDEEEKSNEEEKNNDEEEKSDEEDNDEKEITLLNRHQWN